MRASAEVVAAIALVALGIMAGVIAAQVLLSYQPPQQPARDLSIAYAKINYLTVNTYTDRAVYRVEAAVTNPSPGARQVYLCIYSALRVYIIPFADVTSNPVNNVDTQCLQINALKGTNVYSAVVAIKRTVLDNNIQCGGAYKTCPSTTSWYLVIIDQAECQNPSTSCRFAASVPFTVYT